MRHTRASGRNCTVLASKCTKNRIWRSARLAIDFWYILRLKIRNCALFATSTMTHLHFYHRTRRQYAKKWRILPLQKKSAIVAPEAFGRSPHHHPHSVESMVSSWELAIDSGSESDSEASRWWMLWCPVYRAVQRTSSVRVLTRSYHSQNFLLRPYV